MSISDKSFWREVKRPIKVLAPMAGYTDSAFRIICRQFGADVVMTELVSADAIAFSKFKVEKSDGKTKAISTKNKTTAEMLSFSDEERPLVIQLFGKYPEKFALAAKWISDNLKPDGIDINMGCPARKVVGSDHGAALLKNPDLACEIVRAVKENTNLPISVKTRLGWDSDDQILEFGPKMISAGAEVLIIHGRTYKHGFSGEARWENIYKLKEIVGDNIVIGNGDIKSIFDLERRINGVIDGRNITLDGAAIGRATFGKPWIFTQNTDNRIQITALKKTILDHARLAFEDKGDKGIIEFRKHLLAYLKGFPGSKALRIVATKIENLNDIEQILSHIV
ncbi:MAG: tRNA-dihydrouridine synthase family protein [Patescibacteria group bacterium]